MMCLKLVFVVVLLLFSATLCMALLDKFVTKCELGFWKSDALTTQVPFSLFIFVNENSVSKLSWIYLASYLLVACFALK